MSSMTEKWEQTLAQKLKVEIRPEFNQNFWAKFHQEFNPQSAPRPESSPQVSISWWSWSLNFAWAAGLVIALTYQVSKFNQSLEKENVQVAIVMEMAPALESIESYSELDDLNLTEEEWKILSGEEVI